MNGWKYLIVNEAAGDVDFAVVFPPCVEHKTMAKLTTGFAGKSVIGAGFVRVYADHGNLHIETYGESVSLGIKSQPGDADFFNL